MKLTWYLLRSKNKKQKFYCKVQDFSGLIALCKQEVALLMEGYECDENSE